jgi:hypothetical protein
MFTNIFRSTNRPKEIELPFPVDGGVRKEFIQHLGYIPLVYYNELQIGQKDLISNYFYSI